MSVMRRKYALAATVGALLILSLVLLGWWSNRGGSPAAGPDSGVASMHSGDGSSALARSDADAPTSEPRLVDAQRHAAASVGAAAVMSRLERASSAQELEAQLVADAQAGDPAAMAELAALTARCGSFWPSQDRSHPRHELSAIPVGSIERRVREHALSSMQAFCDRPYSPGEAVARYQELRAALDEAAEGGDTVARAYRMFEGEDEAALLGVLREADDPWVRQQAMLALASSKGPLARRLDADVFPSHLRAAAPQRLEEIKGHAARWHACSMGAPCGPNQNQELSQCLYLGNCGMGLGVQAYIQQRELTGFEFELMQRYLAALRAQLDRR
jgi:hypothetical protein